MNIKRFTVFKDVDIITPFKLSEKKCLIIENEKIKGIYNGLTEAKQTINIKNAKILDYEDKYLVPGLIDIHAHGVNGVNCYSDSLEPWSLYNSINGVTSYLPTLLSMPLKDMLRSVKTIIKQIENNAKDRMKSRLLGLNIEGPYLNPKYGAQNPDFNIDIKKEDYEIVALLKSCRDL